MRFPIDLHDPARARAEASAALRVAQVELYCDHDAAALSALRRACRTLIDDAVPEADARCALCQLEEAAWHIRRHEMPQAQQALAAARDRLS